MRALIISILLLSNAIAWAQCTVLVLDENKAPLPLAHLKISSLDDSQKKYVISNKLGLVEIPSIFCGKKVKLELSFIGYLKYTGSHELNGELKLQLEPDVKLLNQIVVTAQYAESNPEKAVHKIEILSKDDIESAAAVNLQDVLEQQNNIRINQDQVLGSSLKIQGLSGQNVKILIDGVPVIGRLNGNVDLSQINLQNVERIEIVEGPLAVAYGSDALAGTINIISKDIQEQDFALSANSYYESAGQYNTGFNASLSSQVHQYGAHLNRNYFDGWNPGEPFLSLPRKTKADSSRFQAWKPKEQLFGGIKYRYASGKVKLSLKADMFKEEVVNKGYPRAPYQIRAFDDIYRTHRNDFSAQYTHQLNDKFKVESFFAFNRFIRKKNTYIRDLSTLQAQLTENTNDHDTSQFTAFSSRGNLSSNLPQGKFNFQIGYDVNIQSAEGKRIENASEMQDYALFATSQVELNSSLKLMPGLRIAYNNLYKAPLIPSLNLLYSFSEFKLRASYAKGFRAPSLKELYFNFNDINHNIVGNPALEAEYADHVNAHLKWSKLHKQQRYTFELGAYGNRLKNLINLSRQEASNQFIYQNIGLANTVGSEISFAYNMPHLDFSVAYAYNGVSYQLAGQDASKMNYSPEFSSKLSLKFLQEDAHITVFFKHNGASVQTLLDENGANYLSGLEAYSLFDLSLGKKFLKERLSLNTGMKNILDVQGVNNFGNSGAHSSGGNMLMNWGRTVFLSMNYQL